jgi:hypothetical protein
VNTNSAPQSLHFNTRSVNSMTGFPETGTYAEIRHGSQEACRSRFPVCARDYNKGPDRHQKGSGVQNSTRSIGQISTAKIVRREPNHQAKRTTTARFCLIF